MRVLLLQICVLDDERGKLMGLDCTAPGRLDAKQTPLEIFCIQVKHLQGGLKSKPGKIISVLHLPAP